MMGGARRRLVLVVEDDAAVRRLISTALGTRYDVREAEDGLVASELLGQLGAPPDLIICDVMMPRVDGFTFVKMLREHQELHAIPVIFLTAKTMPQAVIQGIQLGARHYIQKPFRIPDLMDKVTKLLT